MRFAGILLLCLTVPVSARADDSNSGNAMLPHCLAFLRNDVSDPIAWVCGGTISTTAFFGRSLPNEVRFCRPANVTNDQLARIVVRYLENRPEQLHEPLALLAAKALREAWPCK
jgi:hypothetical protein